MQSSSALFPVRLIAAEGHHGFLEDTYLLKPNNGPDRTVEIAVTRYAPSEGVVQGHRPLVLLHGLFSNRLEWLPFPGQGIAHLLASQGHEVWMAEMRGHGYSPVNRDYQTTCFKDYIQYDLPAINDFILEKTRKRPVWIGRNVGGLTISAALATGYLKQPFVSGVVFFDTQVGEMGHALKLPLGLRVGRFFGKRPPFIDGLKNGYGAENEPTRLVDEILGWTSLSRWRDKQGEDYSAGLSGIQLPVLSVTSHDGHAREIDGCDQFNQALSSAKLSCRSLDVAQASPVGQTALQSGEVLELSRIVLEWLKSEFYDKSSSDNGQVA